MQEKRFGAYWETFWKAAADTIKRHNVFFVGGDFNMALFVAEEALREHSIDAVFLGSYAWREKDIRGRGVEGLPGCRYDSLALFAVKPVSTLSRLLTVPILRGDGAQSVWLKELDEFEVAQGYAASSYLGGEPKILAAFQHESPSTHGGGDILPHIKQKALRPEVWNAAGGLRGHGAHMPLLFYVGQRSRRSEKALAAREINHTRRGWGPNSSNRAWSIGHLPVAKGKDKNRDLGKGKNKGKQGEGTGGKGKDKGEVKGE